MSEKWITLSNDQLTVEIRPFGAALMSIRETDAPGAAYLWHGDHWAQQAPNLFPYVGRLTEGKYRLEGAEYPMDIHGFAKDSPFRPAVITENEAVFCLEDDENTYASYPWHFRFSIGYLLQGRRLTIRYRVENLDEKEMHFGVGGHPGFHVPLEKGLDFTDYYLEFSAPCHPVEMPFSEDCYVEGDPRPYPLQDDRILPLKHGLFDHDAIALKNTLGQVTLKSAKGHRAVRVTYPDMPYLGLWHPPFTESPFLCIEPWTMLASRKGIIEDLATHPDILHLAPGKTYENTWMIECI